MGLNGLKMDFGFCGEVKDDKKNYQKLLLMHI